MNCDKFRSNIAAFLAGELDERSTDEQQQHAEECSNCAAEIKSTTVIVDMLLAHPDKDVPESVESRVLSSLEPLRDKSRQQMPSPVPLRSRIQGVLTLKRSLVAVGLMAIVVAVGLGLLPSRKGNAVLAQVAEAMANVKSVHLTGFNINPETGERWRFEVWIKNPARYRKRIYWGNGIIHDTADDGTRKVVLGISPGDCSATISSSEGTTYVPCIPVVDGGLNLFSREGILEATKDGIVDSCPATLPDGREIQVIELAGFDLDKYRVVITIDKATDLLVQVEVYHGDKLAGRIENIEYNIDLPDSMFDIEIPRNAKVKDERNPPSIPVPVPMSPKRQALQATVSKQMADEGGDLIGWNLVDGGSCGTPYHQDIYFKALSATATRVWYVKSRNAYYIFGKALVTDFNKLEHVVEDGWFVAPSRPKELLGTLVICIDKPGDYKRLVTDYGTNIERIQNIGKGPLILMDQGSIKFYGEAKVYPQGTVYHNGEVVEGISDMCLRGLQEYDLARADFGSLPDSEVTAMKAEMEKHNVKVRLIKRHRQDVESALERLPDDAYVGNRFDPGKTVRDNYFECDPKVGMTLIYIPSRDSIYVVGRGRVVARDSYWRTERIVENEEVSAPGPEYARYYKERQERRRKERNE